MTEVSPKEFNLDVEQGEESAVHLLANASGLSNQAVKHAMQKGAVWVTRGKYTQRLRRASKKLSPGDKLHFYYNETVLAEQPSAPELVVDEGDYSIWNKPYGLRSQGSKWGDHCTLPRWVEQHLEPQRPAFLVHRLDRAASGLIMVAHSKQVAAKLSNLFEQRQIEKHYRVFVAGDFAKQASMIYGPNRERLTVDDALDGRTAVSHFRLLKYCQDSDRSLLDVQIETGRKHQVRQHLAGLGFPVIGDRLYGVSEENENLQLTACSLAFECPVTGEPKSYSI